MIEHEEIKAFDFENLYNKLTPAERIEAVFFMLQSIEARRADAVKAYKADPARLNDLSLSELRKMAEEARQEAYDNILTAFPQTATLMLDLECLTAFSTSEDAPTISDLLDVKSSLEDVWAWSEKHAGVMPSAIDTTIKSGYAYRKKRNQEK